MADINSNYAISVAVNNIGQITALHTALKDIQRFATGKDMIATLRFDTKDEGRISASMDKITKRKKELEKPLNIRGTSGSGNLNIDTKSLERVFNNFTTRLTQVLAIGTKRLTEPKYQTVTQTGNVYRDERGRILREAEAQARIARNEQLRVQYQAASMPPDFATFNRAVIKFDAAVTLLATKIKSRQAPETAAGEQAVFVPKAGSRQEGLQALAGRLKIAQDNIVKGIFGSSAADKELRSILDAAKKLDKDLFDAMAKKVKKVDEALKAARGVGAVTDEGAADTVGRLMEQLSVDINKSLSEIVTSRVGSRRTVSQSSVQKVTNSVKQIDRIMASFVKGLETTFENLQTQLRTLPNQIAALSRIPVQSHITDINQAIEQSTSGIKRGIYGKPVDQRAVDIDDARRAELEAMVKQLQDIKTRGSKLRGTALQQYEKGLDQAFLPILQGLGGGGALGQFTQTYVNRLISRLKTVLARGTEIFAAGSEAPIEGLRQEATQAYIYGPRGAKEGLSPTISARGIVGSRTYNMAREGSTAPFTTGAIEELKRKLEELNNVKLVKIVEAFQSLAASAQIIGTHIGPLKDIIAPAFKAQVRAQTTLSNLNTTTGVGKNAAQRKSEFEIEQLRLFAQKTELERVQLKLDKLPALSGSSVPIIGSKDTEVIRDRNALETQRLELVQKIAQTEERIKALQTSGTARGVGGGGRGREPKLLELRQRLSEVEADPSLEADVRKKLVDTLRAEINRRTGRAQAAAILDDEARTRKQGVTVVQATNENEARREREREQIHKALMQANERAAATFSRTLGFGTPQVRDALGFEGFRELLRKRIGQLESSIQRNNLLEQRVSTNQLLGLPPGRLESRRVESFAQTRDIINELLAILRGAARSGTLDKVPEGITGSAATQYLRTAEQVKSQLAVISDLENKLRTRGTRESVANLAVAHAERLRALAANEQAPAGTRQAAAASLGRLESNAKFQELARIAADTQVKLSGAANEALRLANNMAKAQNSTKNFVPFVDSLVSKVRTLGSYVLVGGVLFNLVFKMREFVTTIISAQAELVRIEQILGRTSSADRGLISEEAFNQARKYGIALKDILNTVKLFAQSGFTLQQSLKLSEAVAQAAVGGGLEPQQAVETAIAVQNLSQGRTSATDIFGRIAKIERINAVTGQDLSIAIQRVGSLAQQLQSTQVGPVDAFDAVIGATTQIVETTRVTGNQAATSLRFILARLAAPDIANKLQGRFGISLAQDPEGRTLRPLTDILADVAERYKKLVSTGDTGEANRLLVTLAGARQVNAAAALLTNFNKAMETAVESSYAFGDIERRTAAQLETLQSKLGQLNNAVVGFINKLLEQSGALRIAGAGVGLLQKAAQFGTGGTVQGLIVTGLTAAIATGIGRVGGNVLRNPETVGLGGRIAGALDPRRLSQAPVNARNTLRLDQIVLQQAVQATAFERLKKNLLLTTVDPQAAVTAQGGAVLAGRVLQAFGVIGRVLGPIAIGLTIFAGLNVLTQIFDSFKKIAEFKIPTQAELLKTTEFGKQYQQTANNLGVTVNTLQTTLADVVKEATDKAKARGIKVDEILRGQEKDPRFRQLFQDLLVSGTAARIPEIEIQAREQAGPGADERAIGEARTNLVLSLFRDSAKLLGGPAEAANVEIKKKLEEFMGGVTDITFERLQKQLETTKFGAGKFQDIINELPDTLSQGLFKLGDFFANDVFGKMTDNTRITARRIVEDQNVFSQVFPGVQGETTVGERLDLIYGRFYERNPQKRADVEGRLRLGIQAALGVDSAQQALDKQQAQEQAGTPGAKYLEFIRSTARKVLKDIDTGATVTVAGAEHLKRVLAALFSPDNATRAKLVIDTINQSLASIRDRVAEIVGGFVKQMQEISTVAPRFARAGIRFDAGGERLSAAQTALRNLSGVEGQIRLDLLKEHVRLESVRASAEKAGIATAGAEALDQVSTEGVGRFVAGGLSDLIASGRALTNLELADPEFVARQKARIQSIRDNLFAVVNDRELLTNLPPDILNEFDKVLEEIGVASDISGSSLTRLLNLFERITAIEQKRLVTHQRELVALQAENALRAQLLDIRINSQTQELQAAAQIAEAYRKGSGIRLELAQIELERSATIARAEQARVNTRSQLLKEAQRTGGVVDQEALARADAEFRNATQSAPAIARMKEFELLVRKSSEYVVAVLSKMNESIDSATSGLVDVLSSYESFTNGQQIKTILQGFSNTFLRNAAQNIQQSLFGQGGLLRSPMEKIFEQQAIDSQGAQLAQAFSSTVDFKLGRTFETGAEVLHRRILAALTGISGPGTSVRPLYGPTKDDRLLGIGQGILGSTGGALTLGLGAALVGAAQRQKAHALLSQTYVGGVPLSLTPTGGGLTPAQLQQLAGVSVGGIPIGGLLNGVIQQTEDKTGKTITKFNSKALLGNAASLVGAYGGAALGGAIGGRGVAGSYAGEGAALGTALGQAFLPVPVVGGLVGGLLGGAIGGLFGSGDESKPPPELQTLERIERNQRATITAIENQTRQLLSVDNRLLNVPASFTVPGYRPLGLSSGNSTGSVVINIDARGASPGMEANIESAVRRGLRAEGTYTDFRY